MIRLSELVYLPQPKKIKIFVFAWLILICTVIGALYLGKTGTSLTFEQASEAMFQKYDGITYVCQSDNKFLLYVGEEQGELEGWYLVTPIFKQLKNGSWYFVEEEPLVKIFPTVNNFNGLQCATQETQDTHEPTSWKNIT